MYALKDGYIIKVYDKDKNIIWNAENHDMTLCHQIMDDIYTNMEKKRPDLKGSFSTHHYTLSQKISLPVMQTSATMILIISVKVTFCFWIH